MTGAAHHIGQCATPLPVAVQDNLNEAEAVLVFLGQVLDPPSGGDLILSPQSAFGLYCILSGVRRRIQSASAQP